MLRKTPLRCGNVLEGKPSAFRDAAVMTAGAALLVAGKAPSFETGCSRS